MSGYCHQPMKEPGPCPPAVSPQTTTDPDFPYVGTDFPYVGTDDGFFQTPLLDAVAQQTSPPQAPSWAPDSFSRDDPYFQMPPFNGPQQVVQDVLGAADAGQACEDPDYWATALDDALTGNESDVAALMEQDADELSAAVDPEACNVLRRYLSEGELAGLKPAEYDAIIARLDEIWAPVKPMAWDNIESLGEHDAFGELASTLRKPSSLAEYPDKDTKWQDEGHSNIWNGLIADSDIRGQCHAWVEGEEPLETERGARALTVGSNEGAVDSQSIGGALAAKVNYNSGGPKGAPTFGGEAGPSLNASSGHSRSAGGFGTLSTALNYDHEKTAGLIGAECSIDTWHLFGGGTSTGDVVLGPGVLQQVAVPDLSE
jgi:hypothetical protein